MLNLENISLAYGDRTAVDHLSLTLNPGEVMGLLGPNGAGKSTTISIAAGLRTPDTGAATLDNFGATRSATARRRIGYAPQDIALYDQLTARENLIFFASLHAINKATAKQRADQLLDRVGLTDRATSRVATYSGGMKRRLNLAAALIHKPDLLLLDEPTVGVDPQSRNAILDLVESLGQEGHTILYSTHYMEEAQRICNRVAIMEAGKVLALDTPPALISAHGGSTRISSLTAQNTPHTIETDEPAEALRELLATGAHAQLHITPPSLETVFLNLTGRSLRD